MIQDTDKELVSTQRKTYMRNHYGKFWLTARERKYGFPIFNKSVCQYIHQYTLAKGKILDIGIGTGYPHADYLQKLEFNLHGIDISAILIAKCNRLYPDIKAYVADAEDLPYHDEYFDCVYSISSTKYFPNIEKAITEMIRVTKHDGLVVFDLVNASNIEVQGRYQRALRQSNTVKGYLIGLGIIVLKKRWPNWKLVVIESPSYPNDIYRLLKKLGVSNYQVATAPDKDHPMEIQEEIKAFEEHKAILLVVRK